MLQYLPWNTQLQDTLGLTADVLNSQICFRLQMTKRGLSLNRKYDESDPRSPPHE